MGLYEELYDWSSLFTWHGVYEAVSYKKCQRIFWVSILLISTSLMVWQLYSVIHNYVKLPKYQTSVTTVSQGSIEFPNITVCNYNRANRTRLNELNISDATLSYLYLGLPQNYKVSSMDMNITEPLKDDYDSWKLYYNGSLAFDDIFLDLGHDCQPTFLLCSFGGHKFDFCCNVKPIMNQYGKCLSVVPGVKVANSPIRALQYDPGPEGAMSLVIDPRLDEYSNVIVNDLVSQGIMMLVTNEPEAYQIDDLTSLEPGAVALVSLSASKSFVTDPDYRIWSLPCKQNATLQYMSGPYTHNKCSLDCYIKTVIDYCKCGFATRSELGLPRCTANDVICVNDLWYGSANWTLPATSYFEQCTMEGCVAPCEPRYTFTTRVTKTILSAGQHLQTQQVYYTQLLNRPNLNLSRLIQVDIFYPQIELIVKETYERTSVFDLMSSIGGQIGLWCGMSVISFIQLGLFIYRSTCSKTPSEHLSYVSQTTKDCGVQTNLPHIIVEVPKKKELLYPH